ncbi:MAG: NAD-dependent epimerase/dehydratase family protein [Thermoplasmata archaeon]|nr:NAD-dependent epimerase/dehydratase family protein [Thermoplasmata archaeon]
MKILITGARGQLGSYLMDELSGQHEIIGIDIKKPDPAADPGAHILHGDIKDYQLMMEQTKDVDVVIHTAAQVSVDRSLTDPVFDAQENIMGTVNVLETSVKSMVRQVIYISSAAIFGDTVHTPIDEEHPTSPMSPYGVSKLAGEKYCFAFRDSFGQNVTALRPFNIFSVRQDPASPYSGVITKFRQMCEEGVPLTVEGDGTQTRDFIHVSDVVRMVSLCLLNQDAYGQTFNCGTGIPTSINELADVMIKLSGKELERQHFDARPGDIKHSHADISRAEKILGYRPETGLEKGLAELFSGE